MIRCEPLAMQWRRCGNLRFGRPKLMAVNRGSTLVQNKIFQTGQMWFLHADLRPVCPEGYAKIQFFHAGAYVVCTLPLAAAAAMLLPDRTPLATFAVLPPAAAHLPASAAVAPRHLRGAPASCCCPSSPSPCSHWPPPLAEREREIGEEYA